jgi:hypothetical protein
MHLGHYLRLLHVAEDNLASAFREVADRYADEADVHVLGGRLAQQCETHASRLEPFARRYSEQAPDGPERLHTELFGGARGGPLGLLRDLHDLYLTACECDIVWTLVGQGAQGARDDELLDVTRECEQETATQLLWLKTRMKQAAPQTLVVA